MLPEVPAPESDVSVVAFSEIVTLTSPESLLKLLVGIQEIA
jgi:hypothetical protein